MITEFWKGALIWGIIGLIVGLLIGMAIGWRMDTSLAGAGSAATTTETGATGDTSAATTSTSGTASATSTAISGSTESASDISVADQPAGSAVVVAQVTLPSIGWVAVHEVSADGVIGNVLGAAREPAGTTSNVVVDLLRATVPGGKYAVILYADNGNMQYDVKGDMPILGSDGKPIAAQFSATTPVSPNGQ